MSSTYGSLASVVGLGQVIDVIVRVIGSLYQSHQNTCL